MKQANQDKEPHPIDFARIGGGGDEIDLPDGPSDISDKVTSYDTSSATPTEKVILRALERIAFSLDNIDRTLRVMHQQMAHITRTGDGFLVSD